MINSIFYLQQDSDHEIAEVPSPLPREGGSLDDVSFNDITQCTFIMSLISLQQTLSMGAIELPLEEHQLVNTHTYPHMVQASRTLTSTYLFILQVAGPSSSHTNEGDYPIKRIIRRGYAWHPVLKRRVIAYLVEHEDLIYLDEELDTTFRPESLVSRNVGIITQIC